MAVKETATEQWDTLLSSLNDGQRQAVETTGGPVLLIAGPGAGKTLALVVRTLNILRQGLAGPSEIVLCTFTEKAAAEIRERLRSLAEHVGYDGDLSDLRTGTIHGVCNEYLRRYRHLTPLGNGYEVLDQLTQMLFLFDAFDEIVGPADENDKYLGKWATRWTAVEGCLRYFDKITEELIDPDVLVAAPDPFVSAIGAAFDRYEQRLYDDNKVDFAHIQKLFHTLLNHPTTGPTIIESVRYVMVDEYQDTNYVQEQLLNRLVTNTGNLCVVGDEDQALYRFRGATVRNILEFPDTHAGTSVIELTTNYRSHQKIVDAYNRFMAGADWSNPGGGPSFRFPKTISPGPDSAAADYPAVFSIWGVTRKDEAERFADLVKFLHDSQVIEDYSQVALLLHSVQEQHSGPYVKALAAKGIPAFNPRARAYFDNDEVRAAVAALAVILGYYGDGRGDTTGRSVKHLADYVDDAIADLGRGYPSPHPLALKIQEFAVELDMLPEDGSVDRRPADYLYELLAVEPFASWLNDENRARNLATLSSLLNAFQRYYHYSVVTRRNAFSLRMHLFNSFLRLLHSGGINEYEDPDQPFPKGHVQVMTIHQSKGLEFPVVVVGSLSTGIASAKEVERTLSPWMHRQPFEPQNRITGFDRMRLHYVAFSRAEKLLVLTTTDDPKPHFDDVWQGLPQWPYVRQDLLAAQGWQMKNRLPVKKSYSFTGDVKVYETCPRQYQMFRHLDFTPSRSAIIFFGLLVHQTIEDIHRHALDGTLDTLDDEAVEEMFEANFENLAKKDVRPIGEQSKQAALRQVLNYFHENRSEMTRVIETEVDVSLEKDRYVLVGAIDLLLADDGSLEVLDFKSQKRPPDNHPIVDGYYKQLCLYAHILEQRHGRTPDRLLLYWTGEPTRERALMEFPYRREDVQAAADHFDRVVASIASQDFSVTVPPDRSVCKECDFRSYCVAQGTIPKVNP